MPGPLGIAAISAGGSLLSGFLGSQFGQQDVPDELNDLIGNLQNPNFFLPQIQRAFGPEEETNFNINQRLAQSGIDSPALAEELRQAASARRGDQISQALGSMEGQRLSMLQRALGQRAAIEGRNAQTRASAFNEAASGFTGALTQGLGAQNAQNIMANAGGGQGGPVDPSRTSPVGLSAANASNFLQSPQFGTGGFGAGGFPQLNSNFDFLSAMIN